MQQLFLYYSKEDLEEGAWILHIYMCIPSTVC